VPCGLADYAVTSATALGKTVAVEAFDAALARHLPDFLDALSAHEKRLEQLRISV